MEPEVNYRRAVIRPARFLVTLISVAAVHGSKTRYTAMEAIGRRQVAKEAGSSVRAICHVDATGWQQR